MTDGNGPVHVIALGTDAQGVPLTEDSLFPIGSMTKLAVALAVLRLHDRGQISIDDPLECFVPDSAAAGHGITLKHLLTHTAGLPAIPADAWVYDESLCWSIEAAEEQPG